jgi:hypothetical protein
MFERRRFLRTKVFKDAKIVLAGCATFSCIVRNLTNHGACFTLPSTADLSSEFDLSFDTGRTFRKCRVAWQTVTHVGVSFEQSTAR